MAEVCHGTKYSNWLPVGKKLMVKKRIFLVEDFQRAKQSATIRQIRDTLSLFFLCMAEPMFRTPSFERSLECLRIYSAISLIK